MTERQNNADELFEKYLDVQLSGAEEAAVAESLRAGGERDAAAAMQRRIDATLGRMFGVTPPNEERIAAILARRPNVSIDDGPLDDASELHSGPSSPSGRRQAIGWIAALATAAAVGAVALWRPWNLPEAPRSSFTPQPLATLYRMAVEQGFEPYYECRDAERFAQTFAHRQDIPLELLPMATGSHMLGLSYIGGLSPDTTAMLCLVDAKPVIVFVDRAGADRPTATENLGSDLHVFRRAEHGLVMYEVTPFDAARVLDALAPAKSG